MFELRTPTPATITSVTPRLEKHGESDVLAVSLGLKISASNALLEVLSPGLLAALYTKPDADDKGPRTFEGFELSSLPLLRTAGIENLSVKGCYEGWSLLIPYGVDETSAVRCGGCKVDKFKVVPIEGGSVIVTMRVGTSDVDEATIGKLSMLLGDEVSITLLAPEKPITIDGSNEAFAKDNPGAAKAQADLLDIKPPKQIEAGDAFAAAQGQPDRGDGKDWPFPGGEQGAEGGASAEAAAVIAKVEKRSRKPAAAPE